MIHISTSDCVDVLNSNLLKGSVDVLFRNGYSYRFTNVSRRAILNLQTQPNMSLGFWVNHNLVDSPRTKYVARYKLPV